MARFVSIATIDGRICWYTTTEVAGSGPEILDRVVDDARGDRPRLRPVERPRRVSGRKHDPARPDSGHGDRRERDQAAPANPPAPARRLVCGGRCRAGLPRHAHTTTLLDEERASIPPDGRLAASIDATEREVELVLVGGDPLAGETALMSALKPGDYEVVASPAGGFRKAVDVTTTAPVPEGDEALADFTAELELGLRRSAGTAHLSEAARPANQHLQLLEGERRRRAGGGPSRSVFRMLLAANVGVLPDGSLNLERIQLLPLLAADDDFLGHLLRGEVDPATRLIADPTPRCALNPRISTTWTARKSVSAIQLPPASRGAG